MTGDTKILSIQDARSADLDADLVEQAQRDPLQFQGVYERWAAPVYQYFHFRTGDQASAEDLTSQVFLAAYQALPRYRHRGHFAAWLFTIARHQASEYFRRSAREVPIAQAEQIAATSDPLAEVTHKDELRTLRRLILRLPEDEQELIRLRYVAELSFADMAILLDRREDAVKKALYRLQARLQSLLEHKHA